MNTLTSPFTGTSQDAIETVLNLQNTICEGLAAYDSKNFVTDHWSREEGGGGITRVLEKGATFEKAGVNVSAVHGTLATEHEQTLFQTLLKQLGEETFPIKGARFFATGVSLVIHPLHPRIPTVHLNYRYFEMQQGDDSLWWFGGGTDLTPYFLDTPQITHFHEVLKNTCDSFDPQYYPRFKEKCDRYFYLPHRHEHRGVGGLFFDYQRSKSQSHYLDFMKACGNAFLPAYSPIVEHYYQTPFTEAEKQWQRYRRGRYAEFNLLHDRGTLFGLKTNGRIESILMSLPPDVSWIYDEQALTKDHEELLAVIRQPKHWG